jgi:hypothetical protein
MQQWDRRGRALAAAALGAVCAAAGVAAEPSPVYRCPGNPVLYTDTLTAKEAQEKGCRTLEGAPITVIQGFKPRPAAPAAPPAAQNGSGPAGTRISPVVQRARDSDARQILEAELKTEEERLAGLQKEYNNGEPERLGSERNYQKYVERVAEMKAQITRKEGDIVAIKRELAKLQK